MKTRFFFTLFLLMCGVQAQAQNATAPTDARSEIRAVIDRLFDGMRKGDSTIVRSVFHPKVRMATVSTNREGKMVLQQENSINGFLKAVGTPHPQVFDERISEVEVWADGNVGAAWMRFHFYLGTTFSHCGVNTISFTKEKGEWKMIFLSDTRQRQGCLDDKNQPVKSKVLPATTESEVRAVTNSFFEGLKKADVAQVQKTFHPNLRTISIMNGANTEPFIGETEKNLELVRKSRPNTLNEKLYGGQVRVDGNLAMLVGKYTFHQGTRFSHCGTDIFHFVKTEAGWQMLSVAWNVQQQNCPSKDELELSAFIDQWHRAASTADEAVFFGSLTRDGVYLGTDETERWLTPEFEAWGNKYFQRETAWDFHPYNRHIMFSPDQKFAYWDELLDTWMGTCRGSGVAIKTPQGWKIKHFNLAVMIPNDDIDKVIEVVKN